MSTQEIKIGVLVTLMGPFATMGQDGLRGVAMALNEFGSAVNDIGIRVIKEGTNAVPDTAFYGAQKLIERDGVDFIIGPLSGNEGFAVRDYAKTKPDKTFINGTAGAQDITLRDPAPNFFSFSANGVQWMAGLGKYAYEKLGFRRVAIVGEDYSFPHGQAGGFLLEFCLAGGRVAQKFWVPLGTTNYAEVIKSMPSDIDAIFTALGGADALNFIQQYHESGGSAQLIGGSLTVDQNILSVKGALSERVVGMASSSLLADDNPAPAWQQFVRSYCDQFPDGMASPTITAYGYYVNTKAALLGLKAVNADLSGDQSKFRAALCSLEFESPTGPIKLDHNRNAIATTFIRAVDKKPDGSLYNKMVKAIPNVNQTLGMPEVDYLAIGSFDRDNPNCP